MEQAASTEIWWEVRRVLTWIVVAAARGSPGSGPAVAADCSKAVTGYMTGKLVISAITGTLTY
ncbi:MAG TPA: hypothetical protein VLA80_14330 [Actinomycetota bacterium]|nr:hypothetical protein [Actinomycetota bacterium]